MTLRIKLEIYILIVHMVFAVVGVILLWENQRIWIFLLEAFLIVSVMIAFRLIKRTVLPMEILSTGADLIRSSDLSHNFSEVKVPEINDLVILFNEMINRLREERILAQEQHFFLHKILEHSPIGIITLDFDNKIDLVNSSVEDLLKINRDNLYGKKLANVNANLARTMEAVRLNDSIVIILRDRRRVKCTRSQYMDRGFKRTFIILEELTHELWKSEKAAYEKLIRTISHELNNSLGATNSILHSCLNYGTQLIEDDREDFENALKVAIERTNHLNNFMKSYADVVRLPSPRLQPVNVEEFMERIVRLIRIECEERGISVRMDLNQGEKDVRLDVVLMEQVFLNILRNAAEAIGSDGHIDIKTESGKSDMIIIIQDNGPGLSPEARDNLFTPFFSTKKSGRGIGLTLVQEVLKAHGFDYSLDTYPGRLTQFRITIPVNQ